MYLAHALVASALALRVSAMLIPLEIVKAAEQRKSDLASLLVTTGVVIDLDCPDCPFFDGDVSSQPQYGVENKIRLEFEIDSSQSLTINGLPIFSSDPSDAAIPYVVSAPQISVEDGHYTDPVRLDFAWERLPHIESARDPDISILPVRFTILGLQGHPVKVDSVAVDLLQTPQRTSIARFAQIPFEETPGALTCDPSSKWSLCRLRAIIAARLQSVMDAAKTRAHAAQGWANRGGCQGKLVGAKGKHHGHGHHKGGHYHHSAHRMGHILHQTLRFFVIPALLGIIGGLMASAVGMLVGQFIAYLWVRFHRNGRRGNASVRVVEIVVDEAEKEVLLAEGDFPPHPQYHDVEAALDEVIIEDEKH